MQRQQRAATDHVALSAMASGSAKSSAQRAGKRGEGLGARAVAAATTRGLQAREAPAVPVPKRRREALRTRRAATPPQRPSPTQGCRRFPPLRLPLRTLRLRRHHWRHRQIRERSVQTQGDAAASFPHRRTKCVRGEAAQNGSPRASAKPNDARWAECQGSTSSTPRHTRLAPHSAA